MIHEINYTTVGRRYTTSERLPQIEEQVKRLAWHELNDSIKAPFMPGSAIQTAIRELGLPNVSRIAWNGALTFPGAPGEDGEYPGFYGIEANYANGRVRVYVVDTGTELLPVRSDFWPERKRTRGETCDGPDR